MKLLTKRDVIRDVADRWLAQYHDRIEHGDAPIQHTVLPLHSGGVAIARRFEEITPSLILARLRALDLETATEADIDRVIGGAGWCELKCAECHEPADQVAIFQGFCELDFMRVLSGTYIRDPDDPESWPRELRVCGACVFKAFKLLEQYR